MKNVKNKQTQDKIDSARNSRSPSELSALSHDTDPDVRAEVARNINTPVNALEVLADDSNEDVLRAVALNDNTPMHILDKLHKDHTNVRDSIAQNATWIGAHPRVPRTPRT